MFLRATKHLKKTDTRSDNSNAVNAFLCWQYACLCYRASSSSSLLHCSIPSSTEWFCISHFITLDRIRLAATYLLFFGWLIPLLCLSVRCSVFIPNIRWVLIIIRNVTLRNDYNTTDCWIWKLIIRFRWWKLDAFFLLVSTQHFYFVNNNVSCHSLEIILYKIWINRCI